jgi:formate hydrogenlyase subunit 3/multisubunit Na+/H+ antiporter MnhD subunit
MIDPAVVLLAPPLIALLLVRRRWTRLAVRLLPLAALPALVLALSSDAGTTRRVPWFVLESWFGMGFSGPPFLFFTALLWMIAGWYASTSLAVAARGRSFAFFWLLTLTGNIGVVLAGDVASFYTFFALMTFSAAGLVFHERTDAAMRAGRIYVATAVAGEAMILAALVFAVTEAGSLMLADAAAAVATSERRDLIVVLTLLGFGVKAGMVPLHVWLPLAHPAAPVPASAVLSGAMIKAGLLGWIHLLPAGHLALPGWSVGMVCIGLFSTFYAVACGFLQDNPKTLLAYSSVSQMGVLLIAVGAGMAQPWAWSATLAVVSVYALNHAFCKGALFLGVEAAPLLAGASRRGRMIALAGLALPALAIAGAPLMGGAIAKYAVKMAVADAPAALAPWLRYLLPLSAVATSLLLGRFLLLMWPRLRPGGGGSAPILPWVASLTAAVGAVWFAAPFFAMELVSLDVTLHGVFESVWPILAGGLLLVGLHRVVRRRGLPLQVPPGDLLLAGKALLHLTRPATEWLTEPQRFQLDVVPVLERAIRSRRVRILFVRSERALRSWKVAGSMMALLLLMLWMLSR